MKLTIALITMIFASAAQAQVIELSPFAKSLLINTNERPKDIWIYSAYRTSVPTKMEVVEAPCRSSEESATCTESKVIETAPGFVLNVRYQVGARTSDSDNEVVEKLYIRAEDAPAAMAATKPGSFLYAKKANALFALASKNITRNEKVVDESKSELCDSDVANCTERLVYKNIDVSYLVITPTVK